MTNATSDLIELNLDTDYLEVAIVTLIREYLARKVSSIISLIYIGCIISSCIEF